MKSLKYVFLVVVLCAGLSSMARAHLTIPIIPDVHPNSLEVLKNLAGFPHTAFFCSSVVQNVPDSGASAILLGCALAGLALWRRFVKR
jgi:VPDSG-CTERM motif